MTSQHQQENISAEWDRVVEALREVEVLLQQELWNGAISRVYYAAFHAAKALLLSEGIEVYSHRGLGRMFNLHFIKTQILDSRFARILSRAQKYREEADYSSEYAFSKEEAETGFVEVQALIEAVKRVLQSAGHLS